MNADVPFRYYVPAADDAPRRDEPYHRMAAEGLLPTAMSAVERPTLARWRRAVNPRRCWLLRCEHAHSGQLLGVGIFTPWRGRVWEFDFTAFRDSFSLAVPMARGGFAWIFAHAPCDAIMGLCPAPNRHAHGLARACGFQVLGRLPGACWWARRGRHVDGVLVMVARNGIRPLKTLLM